MENRNPFGRRSKILGPDLTDRANRNDIVLMAGERYFDRSVLGLMEYFSHTQKPVMRV